LRKNNTKKRKKREISRKRRSIPRKKRSFFIRLNPTIVYDFQRLKIMLDQPAPARLLSSLIFINNSLSRNFSNLRHAE